MDCIKMGRLIRSLRLERHLTQKQLADAIGVSDKTVSKWERALGCPDVSLLGAVSAALNVNIQQLLEGDLSPNDSDGGNMKRIKFYHCPGCGNLLTATGEAEVACCGRKLSPMIPNISDETHCLKIEQVEEDYYITFPHEMTKAHHLNFVAYVNDHQMLFVKLYPEQGGEVRFPQLRGGKFYFGCNQHGLWAHQP